MPFEADRVMIRTIGDAAGFGAGDLAGLEQLGGSHRSCHDDASSEHPTGNAPAATSSHTPSGPGTRSG
jgi:hypothetical protein